ncbi:DUF4113 domain-containing protein [Stutzerimonas stutzeri]|nr:DUF4113 domain-containing protein [Stutzerimonas stutzeri]
MLRATFWKGRVDGAGAVTHMRRELLSPSYTKDWSELLVVKAQ